MNVDPQVYYDAASACDRTSRSMRAQVESLRGSLAGCGAMVGDYDSVKQWGTGYDKGVSDFFRAAETWVDASSKLAEVANAAGYNWAVAEHTANPSPGPAPMPPAPTQTSTYLQCMAPPPSSLGKNGDGLDTDVPGLLEQIGVPVPDGDSTKLSGAADAWQAFAAHPDTTGAGATISTAATRFEGLDAPDVAALTDHLDVLQRSATELVSTASALAAPVAAHNSAVSDLRAGIKTASDDLVKTLGAIGAVTGVAVIATVLFTGGMALLGPAEGEAAAGSAALTAAIAAAANTIRGLMTASALAVLLGAATATFAAINGVTMVSALEGITMLVAQHVPVEGAGDHPEPTSGVIDETAAQFNDRERSIAEVLSGEGQSVTAVPVSGTARTPDALVDGVPTEFKSLDPGASNDTVKNALNSARGQAEDVVVDARESGLTEEEASRGLRRFLGTAADQMKAIRIIGEGWEITWP